MDFIRPRQFFIASLFSLSVFLPFWFFCSLLVSLLACSCVGKSKKCVEQMLPPMRLSTDDWWTNWYPKHFQEVSKTFPKGFQTLPKLVLKPFLKHTCTKNAKILHPWDSQQMTDEPADIQNISWTGWYTKYFQEVLKHFQMVSEQIQNYCWSPSPSIFLKSVKMLPSMRFSRDGWWTGWYPNYFQEVFPNICWSHSSFLKHV